METFLHSVRSSLQDLCLCLSGFVLSSLLAVSVLRRHLARFRNLSSGCPRRLLDHEPPRTLDATRVVFRRGYHRSDRNGREGVLVRLLQDRRPDGYRRGRNPRCRGTVDACVYDACIGPRLGTDTEQTYLADCFEPGQDIHASSLGVNYVVE